MPSYSTFTLDDADASDLVELLGREASCAVPQSIHDCWKRIQAKVIEGRYVASHDKLTVMDDLLGKVKRLDDSLNDPKGDGSGDEAESPTGDSYNSLWELVQEARDRGL